MTAEWRSISVYTASVDALLSEVVDPFFNRLGAGPAWGFWERHFAGGSHVRIRIFGPQDEIEQHWRELEQRARQWLEANPSPGVRNYSPALAARLLELEGVAPGAENLTERADCVVQGSYPDALGRFFSESARRLYEKFRSARGPLAANIIRHGGDRRAAMFRLYLVVALTVGRGDYAKGSVSFRSHWEGFHAAFPSESLLKRVEADYEQRKAVLAAIAGEVRALWRTQALHNSPFLEAWHQILRDAEENATRALQSDDQIFMQFESVQDVRAGRDALFASKFQRTNAFVEQLWSDEKFLLQMQHDIRFLRPRVLVNFLYDLVSAVGIDALEKMVLCHHAFRAVEDLCGVDLSEYLAMNMNSALGRHDGAYGGSLPKKS